MEGAERRLVGRTQHDDRAVPIDQVGFSDTRWRLSERVERAVYGLRCCLTAGQVSPDYRVEAKAVGSNLRHRSWLRIWRLARVLPPPAPL